MAPGTAARRRKKAQRRATASRRAFCALLCLFAANTLLAQGVFDPKTATYEELIFRAQRYGSTAEKRAEKKQAWDELFARGAGSLREVMKYIHLENVGVGVLAQNMIDQMDPEDTAPVLFESLKSENPRTRKMAAYFLGFHYTPQYADDLLPLLDDEEAAGAAIRTLGKWRARSAIPGIARFLSSPKEIRRIAAANALRDIGDPSAAAYLEPLLRDRYFTVRRVAERALAVLSPEE